MKKKILIAFVILTILILVKYFTGEYEITYKVDKYKVKEIYKDNTMKFIINDKYVYAYKQDRKIFKKKVESIEEEKVNNKKCVNPVIHGYKSYVLCLNKDELESLEVAKDNFKEINISDDFKYNKLNDNEYMLIWKYDGFYYLNGSEYTSINLFNNTRYSNDLMIKLDKYLLFPKYEKEYTFDTFIVLDMTNGKYDEIKTETNINYDSYYAGNIKNKMYLFDNKNENLFEINLKKNDVELVGNKLIGYIKYKDGKKINASLSDYTKNKVTYFESVNKIISVKDNYYYIDKTKVKYNNNDIKVIDNYEDVIYYIYEDNIYKYENSKSSFVAHFFELNFNNKMNVFVYKK